MFHVCELQQRLHENLYLPKNIDAPQMEWSKENRLDLLRSAKSGRVLVRRYAEI
jgi:hypothetical protein